MWGFLARKGLYTLTPAFPEFILNIGFTIEARKDEEMPGKCIIPVLFVVLFIPRLSQANVWSAILWYTEVLLGGCRVLNLDPEKAVVDGVDDAEI